MSIRARYQPQFEPLKALLLDIAQTRSVDGLVELLASRLGERRDVARVRLWLVRPGDRCDRCPSRPLCHDRTACLHRVDRPGDGDEGGSARTADADDRFDRIPLGVGDVGRLASEQRALSIEQLDPDAAHVADPEWIRSAEVRSFGGQPMVHGGKTLGVLAVFTRVRLDQDGMDWLRMIADHAASAIVNARAFEENNCLRRRLELENSYLRQEVMRAKSLGKIVGKSAALRKILEQIELVAPTDASVLILGEPGTGKELVAREIHRRSGRRSRPLIRLDCSAVSPQRCENELFGHARGSVAGAAEAAPGRLELSDGGTLFLDGVGELTKELQESLLRFLKDGCFRRNGEETSRSVDVRIIAASHRDLASEVKRGRFDEELYHRLNIVPIEMIPLRRRMEDVAALAPHLLDRAARRLKRPRPRLSQSALAQLQSYDWPGNVRELQNVIERAVLTARAGQVRFDRLGAPHAVIDSLAAGGNESDGPRVVPDEEFRRHERANVMMALECTGWKVYGAGGAAELLGLKPTTLASRMRKMGIRKPRSG